MYRTTLLFKTILQLEVCSTIQEESNINIIILGVAEYTATVFALYAYKMLLIIGYLFYVLILMGCHFRIIRKQNKGMIPDVSFEILRGFQRTVAINKCFIARYTVHLLFRFFFLTFSFVLPLSVELANNYWFSGLKLNILFNPKNTHKYHTMNSCRPEAAPWGRIMRHQWKTTTRSREQIRNEQPWSSPPLILTHYNKCTP